MRLRSNVSSRAPLSGAKHHKPARLGANFRGLRLSRRAKGGQRNLRLPYSPPEDWHEPRDEKNARYRFVVRAAGEGFRHVLTPSEIRERLQEMPARFVEPLEVVQLSQMTRKKLSFPCYGMQWGAALYLYPIEESLVEHFDRPPKPEVYHESRLYGGRWEEHSGNRWRLVWTERAIKDFYLYNILVHELGHLLDDRNTSYGDRERYAEWFAIEYGYQRFRRTERGRAIAKSLARR